MIKKMSKILTSLLLGIAFVIAVSSCASTSMKEDIASIRKYDDAMLWEINGTDINGEPSKLYVLGTIHLGDDRLYPLSESVLNAYESSDRFVGELSSEDYNNMVPAIMGKQFESMRMENERISAGGKPLISYFNEDELKFLLSYFRSEDVLAALFSFEPWVLNTSISGIPMEKSGLDPSKGIDAYIVGESVKNNKVVEGLDSLETQLDVLSYGDWDTQLAMLKDLLKELMEDIDAVGQEFIDLYEAYLTFDETKLAEIESDSLDVENQSEYEKGYTEVVLHNRNAAWADKFDAYLKQGGTTFIFAGVAHFVGDDSVFEIMKNNKTLR